MALLQIFITFWSTPFTSFPKIKAYDFLGLGLKKSNDVEPSVCSMGHTDIPLDWSFLTISIVESTCSQATFSDAPNAVF